MRVEGSAVMQGHALARLPELVGRHQAGELDDASYAALYFMHGQLALHGARFAFRRYKGDPRPDAAAWLAELDHLAGAALRERLLHYLERYHFRAVIPNVPAAFCAWLRGIWPLYLCGHVPHPAEVLHAQARGARPVTVIADYPRLLQPVLNKPNAWAFMVHDLEHAYKFFNDAVLHAGQREFFRKMERALAEGRFAAPLRDAVFADKFAYLIGDMNTHPHHSLHYLRAILIEYHLRREQRPLHAALPPAAQAAVAAALAGLECGEEAGIAAVQQMSN